MSKLTGQAEWTWGLEQDEAFATLKTAMTTAPLLAIPNHVDPFRVECDASKFAIGAVLLQQQNGVWHTIAYLSKGLSPVERNYEIYDREMLAMMTSLSEWRHYLMGAERQFEVHSDHKNLEYFRKPQRLNPRQSRWAVELSNYDFKLIHKPGKTMVIGDPISRRPDHDTGDSDLDDQTLLKDHLFTRVTILSADAILASARDNIVHYDNSVLSKIVMKDADYSQTEDGLIYRRGKLVIPNQKSLIGQVIAAHHDSVSAGHPGQAKTQELIYRSYWWPAIKKNVKTYVAGCKLCQRTKIQHQPKAAPLNPNPIPDRNWQHISVDMITHLPEAQGFNAILNIVNMKSKDYISVPCRDELSSEGWINLFTKHVYSKHGLPDKIFSDRGPQFVSKFIKDVYLKLGIKGNPSTVYHPQTDGQTERINQELENYLRIFINHRQTDWPEWLPIAEFKYRNQIHSATGYSPFYLTHGHHANTGVETRKEAANESARQFVDRMKRIQEEASAALVLTKETMKRSYDKHRRESRTYKEGDRVWLESFNIRTDKPHKKLDDKRYGPFEIIKKVGSAAYKLKIPKSWKGVHPVFNEALLTPYVASEFPNQETEKRVPELSETHEEIPEEILDSQVKGGGLQYLIKYKDQPRSENMWRKRSSLIKDHKDMLDKFHTTHPDAPRMPTITVPGGLRNPITQAREITYDKEWDHWMETDNRWKARKCQKQVVVSMTTNNISDIIFQRQTDITIDEQRNINRIWIFNNEIQRVTHVVHVAAPTTQNHHWHYPISSLYRVLTPFTHQITNRNDVVDLHHDSIALW